MKRLLALLCFMFCGSAYMHAQSLRIAQPMQYAWYGDNNWSLYGPSWHNNEPAGAIGTPYALQVDLSTPGTVRYQFTAGIGGGYRADQIIWYAKRTAPSYLATTQAGTRLDDDSIVYELLGGKFDTIEAANIWYAALSGKGYDSIFPLKIEAVSYDQIAVTGSPHGVPSPSEISNDWSQRGWLHTGVVFYDPALYGGQELRASFWTFQRQAGHTQKLEMQDRGPWTLPAAVKKPPVIFDLKLLVADATPTATISPAGQTIELGQTARLTLSATNAGPAGNVLTGEGVPSTVPANGTVDVTPTSAGPKTYSYTTKGQALLTWSIDDPSATLKLNTPSGPMDVTAPPLSRYVSVSGDYTLTATNSAGSTTSPIVSVDLPTSAPATATVFVNPAIGPGGTTASVVPTAHDIVVSTGPSAGHTVHRSWNEGGNWKAYLGRDGVQIQVTGSSTLEGVGALELQAKTPSGSWYDLAPIFPPDAAVPNGAGVAVSQTFSVQLGAVKSDKPLIPADPSLVGDWTLRGRIKTTSGIWSNWSNTQDLNVLMPVVSQTITAQTLPPSGPEGKWFKASETKGYTVQILVP